MDEEKNIEEQIADLKKARAERERADSAEAKKAELAALQLDAKYSKTHGKRGRDFQIVESTIGLPPIVIKRPSAIAMNRLGEIKDGEEEVDSQNMIVSVLLEPSEEEEHVVDVDAIIRRPG